jgi:[ribosomal protein S18]-alanine N-acetyltransferase
VSCKEILTPGRVADGRARGGLGRARTTEVIPLVALDRLCFGPRAWSAAGWWEVVTRPEWTTILARSEGGPVAAMVLASWAPVASLASLAVHPDWRRRGLGTVLLRQAIERARRGGARWLSLDVDLANLEARRLYRREGFGVVRRFREDGLWRVEMRRRLARRDGR